jgi:hypothetical protein
LLKRLKNALQGRSGTTAHLPIAKASAVVVATTSDVDGLTKTFRCLGFLVLVLVVGGFFSQSFQTVLGTHPLNKQPITKHQLIRGSKPHRPTAPSTW